MKTIPELAQPIILTIGIVTLLPATLRAQTFPGQPLWDTAEVRIAGGITYFSFGARLPACHWIETAALRQFGNSFSLPVWEMRGEVCLDCFDCYNLQTNAVVLGQLPPGDYHLQATSTQIPSIPLPSDPVSYQTFFTVSDTGEPTLTVSREGSGIQIQVRGVAAAEYVVETSADLIDWRPISTRTGAPFSFTSSTDKPQQFFRTSIASGSTLELVF